MIKRLAAIFFLASFLAGCSNAVTTTISDRYMTYQPRTIAVLPVVWTGESVKNKGVSETFRLMSSAKLKELNYGVSDPGVVDAAYEKLGQSAASTAPEKLAAVTGSDAVLYIKIRQWDVSRFVTYASLTVEADYELYSASGERLWQARYSTRDADLRLDKKSLEYAIITAYEPKVQRFVDAVFTTLPGYSGRTQARTFFQWLP